MSEAHNVEPLQQPEETEPGEAANLVSAVAAVMATVKRLDKDQDNAFGKYKFTSVDDFKDALRPVMAQHGLMIGVNQTGFETFQNTNDKGKEATHCVFTFRLWLEHVSGERGKYEGCTVPLPYTGAQTAGIAKSYAIKEYLKGKFLQSTGDLAEDADSYAMDVKLTKAQARDFYTMLENDLRSIGDQGTRDDLAAWVAKNKVLLDALPDEWGVTLRHEYKQAELGIEARLRGERSETPDYEEWRKGFEEQIAAASTVEDLQDIWAEHENAIEDLPSAFKATAHRVYGEAEQKLEGQ